MEMIQYLFGRTLYNVGVFVGRDAAHQFRFAPWISQSLDAPAMSSLCVASYAYLSLKTLHTTL